MRRSKWSKQRKRIAKILAVLFAVLGAVAVFFKIYVDPVLVTVATAKVRSQTNRAINNAVTSAIGGNVVYTDLINVCKNDSGDIVMIQANSVRVNTLARSVAALSIQNIDRIGEQGIEIPLGTLSGIPLLSGKGAPVRLDFIPVGSVECDFLSEFKEAGINQTRHKIYVTVTASVVIVYPGVRKTVETAAQMLITECILIGKVPETYLHSASLDEMLNLVPN